MSMLAASSPVSVPGLIPGPRIRKGRWVGRLVGEELAADQPVLAEEEAVVGGEDHVGVAQAARSGRACRCIVFTPSSIERSASSCFS